MISGLDRAKMDKIIKEIDELLELYTISEVKTEIDNHFMYDISGYCQHCICKTCAIAEVNGGAPGCGDCFKCAKDGKYSYFCNSCKEYYNTDEPSGLTHGYICRKLLEEERDSDDYEVADALVQEIDKKLSAMTDEERDEYFKKMGFIKDE